MRRSLLLTPTVLVCLALAGCDGPADPLAEEIFLQGTLETGGRASHDIVLQDDGLLEFLLLQYEVPDPETGEPIDVPAALGFAIGRRVVPVEPDDLPCAVNGQLTGLARGVPLVLRLDVTDFCVVVFDTNFPPLPEDTTASYAVRVRSTE